MADEIKKDDVKTEAPKTEEKKTPTIEDLMKEIAALKAEKESLSSTADKQKKATSDACADAAEWKRKYRATLDEAERAKQEQAEMLESLKKENEVFRAEKRTNEYIVKLVNAGYSPESATRMASGLPDGVPDTFFEEQKAFLEAQKQAIKTQTLNAQPNLPVGSAPSAADAKAAEEAKIRSWFGL